MILQTTRQIRKDSLTLQRDRLRAEKNSHGGMLRKTSDGRLTM